MIILIGGEKGGTGKTTLATNLSVIRAATNSKILLVDTDKQGTASAWCATRDEGKVLPRIPSVQKFGKSLAHDVKELNNNYNDIIIDAGGRDSVELRSSLIVADKAIFPIRASQFDLWTLECLSNLVNTAQAFNPTLKAYIVINQASNHPGNKESGNAKELIKEFHELNLMQSTLSQRIVYRNAASEGKSVFEYKVDLKAIEELKTFYMEIYND